MFFLMYLIVPPILKSSISWKIAPTQLVKTLICSLSHFARLVQFSTRPWKRSRYAELEANNQVKAHLYQWIIVQFLLAMREERAGV